MTNANTKRQMLPIWVKSTRSRGAGSASVVAPNPEEAKRDQSLRIRAKTGSRTL